MIIYSGIRPGQIKSDKAGANHRVVRLEVSEDGRQVKIQDRLFNLAADQTYLVFWHSNSAGTFHGVTDTESPKTIKPSKCPRLTVGLDEGADLRGVLVTSQSNGADIVAMVVRVTRPFAIILSGYDGRRDWRYLLVSPDGDLGQISSLDYRAIHAREGETL